MAHFVYGGVAKTFLWPHLSIMKCSLICDPQFQDKVIETLVQNGWRFDNPASHEISGFDQFGSRVVFTNKIDAIASLKCQGGIQLWQTESHDVFVSRPQQHFEVSLDGFSETEAEEMMKLLHTNRIEFVVSQDD